MLIPVSRRLPRRFRDPVFPAPVQAFLDARVHQVPGYRISRRDLFRAFKSFVGDAWDWTPERFTEATRGLLGGWHAGRYFYAEPVSDETEARVPLVRDAGTRPSVQEQLPRNRP
jgi:hypothetical protein